LLIGLGLFAFGSFEDHGEFVLLGRVQVPLTLDLPLHLVLEHLVDVELFYLIVLFLLLDIPLLHFLEGLLLEEGRAR